MNNVRIVIFAKAPVAGFAKTRLIPALGEEGAAALAKQLIQHTVKEAHSADIGPVELCVTPDSQHTAWKALELPGTMKLSNQGYGDLGQRMAGAALRVINEGQSVILTGTDCPQLDSARLRTAAQALDKHDCSLIPACDGGYTLLGLRQFHSSLFRHIPWSTGGVADITRERIRTLGWSLVEFPPLPDIDEPADLRDAFGVHKLFPIPKTRDYNRVI